MKKFVLFIYLLSLPVFSIVTELSGDISYQKQSFGTNRENSVISTRYAGSVAFYLWNNTALEINYSESTEEITDNTTYAIPDFSLTQDKSVATTNNRVFGLGFRQALAGKNSTIRPTISLGYARQFTSSYSTIDYTNTSNSAQVSLRTESAETKTDSVFATVALQLKLTKTFSLRGAVNTVFEAFKFNKAKDYLKYSAGFTWYF